MHNFIRSIIVVCATLFFSAQPQTGLTNTEEKRLAQILSGAYERFSYNKKKCAYVLTSDAQFLDKLIANKSTGIANYIRAHGPSLGTANLEALQDIATHPVVAESLAHSSLLTGYFGDNSYGAQNLLRQVASHCSSVSAISIAYAAVRFGIDKLGCGVLSGLSEVPACDNILRIHLLALLAAMRKGGYSAVHLESLNTRYLHTIYQGVAQEQAVFKAAINREMQFAKQGYVCFYHAQRRIYAFQEDLTTALVKELACRGLVNQLPEDFLFIQNSCVMVYTDVSVNQKLIKSARAEHVKLMLGNHLERPKRLLSANLFLFGNQGCSTSCTQAYFMANTNINNDIELDLDNDFCKPFGLCYQQYARELKKLREKYESLFKRGRLLQIGVPENMIDAYAYIAQPGAGRACFATPDSGSIAAPSQVLTYIRQYADEPYKAGNLDSLEYALPLTQAGLLSPYSGCKIIAYDSAPVDTAQYDSFIKKQMRLINRMADDIARAWCGTRYRLVG